MFITRFLFICVLLLTPLSLKAQLSVVDDVGNHIVLAKPAQKIVSLAPHITELLFAAGVGERVVGVVAYSDYPPEALKIPQVGDHQLMDLERILVMQPDLVVAWQSGNPEAQIEKIRSLGLPVYVTEPRNLEDIASSIERLGYIAGNNEQAAEAAAEFMAAYQDLQQRNRDKARVSVFYEIWHEPLITVNDHHLIGDVIRLCGGRNVFGSLSALAPRVSKEAVIEANPDVIIASGVDGRRPEWLDQWRIWPSLTSVREEHLYHIPPDFMHRHTPRILQGAAMMCDYLERVRMSREDAMH
jgi:iron complex transport system substrate-binding protein